MRTSLLCVAMSLSSLNAIAQTTTPPPRVMEAKSEVKPEDGARFRFGVSAGGGGWFADQFSAGLGGVDVRLGVQINDLIGVYAQPHLSFGVASVQKISGATGMFAADVLVDVTLADRFFIAAGGGFGILNNPVGGGPMFRLGAYPLMGKGDARRKGLMIGADLRLVFLSNAGQGLTVVNPFFSIGYEAF